MTRNNTELRDCPQAANKRSLKDDTGYQYRYTSVSRPHQDTVFLFIDKGDVRVSHTTISLICMSTHKAAVARCLSYHQATSGQHAIWALATAPLRRLALSVLFTIVTTSYQTTCTVSERSSIKGNTPMQTYRVEFSHYDTYLLTILWNLISKIWLAGISRLHGLNKIFNLRSK